MSINSSGIPHIMSTLTGISTDRGRFTTHVRLNGDPTKNVVSFCKTVIEAGGGAMGIFDKYTVNIHT